MRYDSESNKIHISVGEFVAISRRKMSPTVLGDEDEPKRNSHKVGVKNAEGEPLTHEFSASGYTFSLSGYAQIHDGKILLIKPTVTKPEKPRKQEEKQARGEGYILAYMYLAQGGGNPLDTIPISITYTNEESGESAEHEETADFPTLTKFFIKCVGAIATYARPEVERVTKRLPTMRALKFPYKNVREGQSELVRSVYRNLARGTTLFACAPTGTGKTVSMIYPAIRLIGEGREEKLFYLTPKATTANAADDCLMLLAEEGAQIRAVRLYSKERCCPENLLCRSIKNKCKYSLTERLSEAVLALYDMQKTVIRLEDILTVANEYSVCPHELGLSYAEICDVIICDINYLFDTRVYLRRFFDEGGKYAFLIDEAHNLGERAREMYSSEILMGDLFSLLENPLLSPTSETAITGRGHIEKLNSLLYEEVKEELRLDKDERKVGATHLYSPPEELYTHISALTSIIEGDLRAAMGAKDDEAEGRVELLRETFYALRDFKDTILEYDNSYRTFIFYEDGNIRVKLFAVDGGRRLSEQLSRGHGAIFFSATLSPLEYYKSVLGGDGTSDTIEVHSPFAPECLSVSIVDKISTRYSERERTLPAVSRTIAATLSARRGKYMVFAPSFEYLDMIADNFMKKYPKIKVAVQKKNMTGKEVKEFLSLFEEESDNYLVGFCVLGGIYSEGIDLAGDKLIGAVVVGIGMPSLSYEREAMVEFYDDKFEAGKLYAYIYPGMNRVLQAAGRVIRREEDRGVIVLIDDRFADPAYKKIIPSLWRGMQYVPTAKDLNERIREFWEEVDKEV